MINGIVCVDKNWGIGKVDENGQGQLLFHLKKDMAFFKEKTLHNVVVMGYSTYLSIPEKFRPLPDRLNVILWDKATSLDCIPDCITFSKFEPLLNFVKTLGKGCEVYISGGASVYRLFQPYYDQVFVNKVEAEDKDACAFFPNLDEDENFEVAAIFPQEEDNGYKTMLYRYVRIRKENK